MANQCLFGSTSSHAHDGSFVPESPTCLVTNTIIFAVGSLGLYAVELREGKDAPANGQVDVEEKKTGKTVCLLLCLTEALYTTGKVVILDSSFCVLYAIIALQEKGLFSGVLIKI